MLAHSQEPILATDDGGKNWKPLGPGLTMRRLKRLFASPDGWWASLESGGLMRYDAKRGAWVRDGAMIGSLAAPSKAAAPPTRAGVRTGVRAPAAAPAGHPLDLIVNDMAFSQTRWFAATPRGVLFSDDRGARWQTLSPAALAGLPVSSVETSRDGKSIWAVSLRGLLYSADGGRDWAWHDLPLKSGGALRLKLAPSSAESDGQTLVAAAQTGIYISRDSGKTWEQASEGLPQLPVADLAIRNDTFLVCLRVGGLFISRDRGRTWDRVAGAKTLADGFFPAITAEQASSNFLAASASDGLYSISFPAPPAVAAAASELPQ
jgi:photosystem II stability/assembly factor-like uncharacterized protein